MEKAYADRIITTKYLRENPDHIFVFGDNQIRKGKKGAAIHRDEPNAYGFVTKKYPSFNPDAYFKIREYRKVFDKEISLLMSLIEQNPNQTFMISRLGSGLANRFQIWEYIIQEGLKCLQVYPNVVFLFQFDEKGCKDEMSIV